MKQWICSWAFPFLTLWLDQSWRCCFSFYIIENIIPLRIFLFLIQILWSYHNWLFHNIKSTIQDTKLKTTEQWILRTQITIQNNCNGPNMYIDAINMNSLQGFKRRLKSISCRFEFYWFILFEIQIGAFQAKFHEFRSRDTCVSSTPAQNQIHEILLERPQFTILKV